MNAPIETLARLRQFNASVRERNPKLAEESMDLAATAARDIEIGERARAQASVPDEIVQESIILKRERPVLEIRDDETRLEFEDQADSQIWKERLTNAKDQIERAIRATGRINLIGGGYEWVGTGWLVAESILVTNRHVAQLFAVAENRVLVFQMTTGRRVEASVDFLREFENPKERSFKILRPLHIEPEPGPDVAFFEIDRTGDGSLAEPIGLAPRIAATENIATIGYPAYDSRIPDRALMDRLFAGVYNTKRLAPGGLSTFDETRVRHNCTTLGGNSGSVVLDLDSGDALALHFSGRFLDTNYAVRADVVKHLLDAVRSGRAAAREGPRPQPPEGPEKPRDPNPTRGPGGGEVSITIPLTVTISLGAPAAAAPPRAGPRIGLPDATAPEEIFEEARAEDYSERGGYQPDFLGEDGALLVELPTINRGKQDVLTYDVAGKTETELRYEHFSVLMSRSRRMCFLSAVNIDGRLSRKTKRVAWRTDPRIPASQQIIKECYGDPPRFSRGHMTRREDPAWGGDDMVAAKRGNADSMHVTNTTPQMQSFNAPIWLELEDHALDHAREDDMKISVFTGPYFTDRDPEMYGVRIPLSFWKVIAFVHDATGRLCATGYEMNQEAALLPEEEFVFGGFVSSKTNLQRQVSIGSIEAKSGVGFGTLASFDPLAGSHESFGGAGLQLSNVRQIRFT